MPVKAPKKPAPKPLEVVAIRKPKTEAIAVPEAAAPQPKGKASKRDRAEHQVPKFQAMVRLNARCEVADGKLNFYPVSGGKRLRVDWIKPGAHKVGLTCNDEIVRVRLFPRMVNADHMAYSVVAIERSPESTETKIWLSGIADPDRPDELLILPQHLPAFGLRVFGLQVEQRGIYRIEGAGLTEQKGLLKVGDRPPVLVEALLNAATASQRSR